MTHPGLGCMQVRDVYVYNPPPPPPPPLGNIQLKPMAHNDYPPVSAVLAIFSVIQKAD